MYEIRHLRGTRYYCIVWSSYKPNIFILCPEYGNFKARQKHEAVRSFEKGSARFKDLEDLYKWLSEY